MLLRSFSKRNACRSDAIIRAAASLAVFKIMSAYAFFKATIFYNTKDKNKINKMKTRKKNFRILSESKKRIHKPPILPCIEKGQSQKEGRFVFAFLEGFWRNLTDWHLLRTETSVRNYWIAPVHCPNDKLILSVGRSGPTWKKKVLVGRRKRCRFSFGV